uniref:Reverse transcriptase domain-containing protein n=1 Tax=Lactuca sativa TaxID=4236 RepID=A0A9R1VRY2_LACSA|nr:hypothetical protein LSAT_V11C400209730 [Lactuca sativa]
MLASKNEVEQVLNKGEEIFILVVKEGPKLETGNEANEEMNSKVGGLIAEFLVEFHDVFPANLPPGLPPIRDIEHQINLIREASLPNKAAYRCNLEETKEMQKQINELMKKGYVRESLSPCVVPVLLVPKKDGT